MRGKQWKRWRLYIVIVVAAMFLLLPLPQRLYMPCLLAVTFATMFALRINR